MIIQCENCNKKFIIKDSDIPKEGRTVQCGNCSSTWHQTPILLSTETKKAKPAKPVIKIDESPSVDNIKASDGKTYRFLGSQWAEVLPSGKTGLFARKKISIELDEITGRKVIKIPKKRKKRVEEVNPSSESLDGEKKLPGANKSKQGIGFFGYILLLIIMGFSIIGVLKTFEGDLINYYPESEYIFDLMNIQLEYLAESVKNLIVIVNDLIIDY